MPKPEPRRCEDLAAKRVVRLPASFLLTFPHRLLGVRIHLLHDRGAGLEIGEQRGHIGLG